MKRKEESSACEAAVWIDELRKKTKAWIYTGIDSYVEIFPFQEEVYGLLTESADGHGYVWLYLIKGTEKALLVDTGFGIGDLQSLVRQLAGNLRVVVCNTQAHFCRSSGNFQFDEVICHKYSAPTLEGLKNSGIWERLFDENGNGIWISAKREDVIDYKDYTVTAYEEGFEFDLGGGCVIEPIWTPGNAQGGIALLDKKHRLLFTSSWCLGRIPVGVAPRVQKEAYKQFASVLAMKEGLERVRMRKSEYDTIYGGSDIAELPNDFIDDLLNTCCEILNDPDSYDDRIIHSDDHTKNVEIFIKKSRYTALAYNYWSVWGKEAAEV